MNQRERDKFTSFLLKNDVISTFKYWVENYGSVKNFYVFCDNIPSELAVRSAFPWNAEDDVKGADAEKFWANLNSRWIDCLLEVKKDGVNTPHHKIEVLKEVFRCYQIPNSAKKFGNKIGAATKDVELAIEELRRERQNIKLYEQSLEEETPQVQTKEMEEKDIEPAVDYEWAQLKTINVSKRSSINREDYPTGRQMRVRVKDGKMYMVLFSKEFSEELSKRGCEESMDMAVDNMNRLVFVFGKGKKYKLSQYLTDGSLKVQNVGIINTLESYLRMKFNEGVKYYIELGRQHYSESTKQAAVVVMNQAIEK